MRGKVTIGVLIAFFSLLLQPMGVHATGRQAAESDGMELWEAMEIAITNNPLLRGRSLETDKAELEEKIAKGTGLPRLELSGSSSFSEYPTTVVPIREVGVFPPLDTQVNRVELSLSSPIYSGGKIESLFTLARKNREASEEDYLGLRQDLLFNVVAAYGKAFHFRHLGRSQERRILSLEKEEELLQLRLKQGRTAKLDLLRLQTQLSQARHDFLVIKQAEADALSQLGSLLGGSEPVKGIQEIAPLPNGGSQESAVSEDLLERNPFIKKASLLIEASEAKVGIARGETKPQVEIFGKAMAATGQDWDVYDDWQAGIRFNFVIWDASIKKNRVAQALLEKERTEFLAKETRNRVLAEAREAHGKLKEAKSRLETASMQTHEAEEALKIEKLRYEAGETTITDFLGAEWSLWVALANAHQASYDLVLSQAAILRALGELSPDRFKAGNPQTLKSISKRQGY